jgi:hypothetical protein
MNPAWEKQYRALLSKGIALGRVEMLPNGAEKREHPRYKMANTMVWGRVDHSYPVIDKSLTGLAFYASTPFPVGKPVRISLRQFFVVEAMVVGCEMVETEPLFLNCQYKVRCRFQNLDPALVQVMVALDMEQESRPVAFNW